MRAANRFFIFRENLPIGETLYLNSAQPLFVCRRYLFC